MSNTSDSANAATAALPLAPCSGLVVGDIIQRGDLFATGDGRFVPMDKMGMLYGLRCIGQPVRKAGHWFRPAPNAGDEARRRKTELP